jgi:hypothetical protein
MMEPHCLPLENLHGKRLNGYTLYLGEVKQLRMSGWKGFTLYLQNSHALLTRSPGAGQRDSGDHQAKAGLVVDVDRAKVEGYNNK